MGEANRCELEIVNEDGVVWTAYIPLLTNPVIWQAMIMVFLVAGLLVGGGMMLIAPRVVASVFMVFPLILGILVALIGFVCLLLGNRVFMRYGVFSQGYANELIDRRLSWASGVGTVAGAASGSAQLAGTGLIASGGRREKQSWSRIKSLRLDRRHNRIHVRLNGPFVDCIYCTQESFPVVVKAIRKFAPRSVVINER